MHRSNAGIIRVSGGSFVSRCTALCWQTLPTGWYAIRGVPSLWPVCLAESVISVKLTTIYGL